MMDPKNPSNDHSLVNKHIQTLRNHFAMEIPIFYSLNHEGSLQNLPATITNLSEEEGEITFAIVPNESSTEQFITMDISEFISGLIFAADYQHILRGLVSDLYVPAHDREEDEK